MTNYTQILPLKTDERVADQFGWLPESVITPGKGTAWREIIGDSGDISTRRSTDTKYLPNLKFSEFNPDLAEKIIRYWSLPNDLILDPFAGRATRGIVALKLGRRYDGYEIAPTTFEKTEVKIKSLGGRLFKADGCTLEYHKDGSAQMIFTCPPYHRLERYESATGQLSDIKDYSAFLNSIRECAKNCYLSLDIGRFAVIVVADWRDGKAFRLFHVDTISAMESAHFTTWDIVVIKNHSPFTRLQAGKVAANRYTSKTHEYALVFRKE